MSSKPIYKTGQVIIKHLLAKENRLTTTDIVQKYLKTYPELRSKHHLKRYLLNPLWKQGQLHKKIDKDVINSATKRGTWFWRLDDKLVEIYKDQELSKLLESDIEPELLIKKDNIIPLLGRTGPYSKFNKEGVFEVTRFQEK